MDTTVLSTIKCISLNPFAGWPEASSICISRFTQGGPPTVCPCCLSHSIRRNKPDNGWKPDLAQNKWKSISKEPGFLNFFFTWKKCLKGLDAVLQMHVAEPRVAAAMRSKLRSKPEQMEKKGELRGYWFLSCLSLLMSLPMLQEHPRAAFEEIPGRGCAQSCMTSIVPVTTGHRWSYRRGQEDLSNHLAKLLWLEADRNIHKHHADRSSFLQNVTLFGVNCWRILIAVQLHHILLEKVQKEIFLCMKGPAVFIKEF